METQTLFQSDDLALATYLIESHFLLKAVKPHPRKSGIHIFLFLHDERLSQAVTLFYTGQARVEPKSYLTALQSLKRGETI